MGLSLSVIIPVYNVQSYLSKCIDSVVRQTFKDFELLLIDDGSTDKSGAICDRYARNDSRIKVIHKSNGGLSDARNAGIEIAQGDFIFFIDSDDYIHEQLFEALLHSARLHSAEIVECGVKDVPENNVDDCSGFDYGLEAAEAASHVYSHDEAVENILDYRFKIMAWNKLYKRELFQSLRFPKGKLHEDEFLTPYLVDHCSKYVEIGLPYYRYVQRKNSIMSSQFNSHRLDILEAHEKRILYFSRKYDQQFDDIMNYHFFVACVNLKVIMGKYYKKSRVEILFRQLFYHIIKADLPLSRKSKAIIYRVFPKIVLHG
ncbi:glycosyltransferase family 2 protein [Lactiplantibacillus plantarum]|uniref:glycosyltransferase family 2 protein n=1 Tax=Lactiplantibacillus plantarum TaxID=1590 RepID=UPI0028FC16A5|nr:glycosyltransferase family 2 protein [Lactiplantibacillus plantarum]WNW17349.1 glycosyltransferase family 2 protein [Lactiplantibacillus plantarum]WNW20326.1 glycosyltransferase family 2 protein [Lactiplantibacillus plantarum]